MTEKIIYTLIYDPLFRGLPVFFPLIVMWLRDDDSQKRARLLVGLIAACLMTGFSVWCQTHLRVHLRPLIDPSIPLKDFVPTAGAHDWGKRLYSFPSDTSMLFFSIATIVFLESRLWGTVAFVWALLTTGLVRVALGWHYPSDILGSLLLGPSCVLLLTRFTYLTQHLRKLLDFCQPRFYLVHACVFVFLADAYSLFPAGQGVLHALAVIGKFSISGRLDPS